MYKQVKLINKTVVLSLLAFMLTVFSVSFFSSFSSVFAASGQGGVEQVTLNPGGGIETNGSDGLRFTINSAQTSGSPNNAVAGQDGVVYRNTYQYCCSAGAPMLNIGGTLYGQSGPAYSSGQNWSSIEIVSTSGVASVGARTASTGNSAAVIRYTATIGELTYTITRTVGYTYPNDYVNDSYTFVIPEGNEDVVKFYLGGDTAPGSSDSGYGVMLTQPGRSVISLNTSSRIMFGFREVFGSKVFDGATTQHYSAPFATVNNGGDIGFVATEANHDAGIMMQWNLGSTPGTQTASLQQFATQQGTNLNASFSSNVTEINEAVTFSASIVNTELTEVTGLGYSIVMPPGLVIGSGSQSNSCGGSATAVAGSGSIVLSGGSVGGGSNCVVSVPVLSASSGTYGISSSNFSDLVGVLNNNVGASSLTVSNPELGTDLNDDGTEDSEQSNVYSYTSSVTEKTVVLEVSDSCSVSSAASTTEEENEVPDEDYTYVNGMMDFSLACGTPGFTSTIKQYYYGVSAGDLVLRKYDPNTQTYGLIEDVLIEQTEINSNIVTVATYEVTDGGLLDTDGEEDGNITDPAGLASLASSEESDNEPDSSQGSSSQNKSTSDGLAETGQSVSSLYMLIALLLTSGALVLNKRVMATESK